MSLASGHSGRLLISDRQTLYAKDQLPSMLAHAVTINHTIGELALQYQDMPNHYP